MKEIVFEELARIFKNNQTLMVGGFGLVGCPLELVQSVINSGASDLTIISNNLGERGKGLGELVNLGRVKKAIGSYFTSNPDVVRAYEQRVLEVELIPQGTFVEAIRAGGAGIGGFYIPTGVGTELANGKEEKWISGKQYLLQEPLRANVALIKAYKADEFGNLIYRKSARNFNPIMATAADIVVAEVEEIVSCAELSPEEIVTPHLFIDYVFVSAKGERRGA